MNNSFWQVMGYALIPASAVLVGGIIAVFWKPGATIRSLVQHFAAGLVFAAVAAEILPDIMHQRDPLAMVVGFTLGIGLMLAVKYFAEGSGKKANGASKRPAKSESKQQSQTESSEEAEKGENESPTSLLVTIGIDLLIDGLLIGIAFTASSKQGFLLTFALAFEVFFLGLSASVALSKAGKSRTVMVGAAVGLALLLLGGVVIGNYFLSGLTGFAFDTMLAFGAAALLYLVTEELLVEAHEAKETPVTTAMFFVGFVVLLLVEMLA
ncbi:MAG: ZIP family metal transporter [Acidobacteriota bacterium]|nr:MAG: ZIP family metal transporter [Acidobacteriota bacterium]